MIDENNNFSEELNKLYGDLLPLKGKLIDLKTLYNLDYQLGVVIYSQKHYGGLNFDSQIISFLGEIGCSIDIDTFF